MRRSESNPPPSTPKRDRLLDTAMDLFERSGYHAIGIGEILAESDLARNTLYHHFASKDDLIVAAIERRTRLAFEDLQRKLSPLAGKPRDQLLAIFSWQEEAIRSDRFRGCICIRAVGEYPDLTSPIHQVAVRAKQRIIDLIERALTEMNLPKPRETAVPIHLLLEGAITRAQMFNDTGAMKSARAAALALINRASP